VFCGSGAPRNVGTPVLAGEQNHISIAIGGLHLQTPAALKYRWLVVAFALLAASAFAVSVQVGPWWTISTVEIGPVGSHSPFGGNGSLTWAGGSARWERFGIATWAGSLIAMLVLIVVAGGVAARRVPRLAAQTALVAIATAGLAAAGFIAARPDNDMPFAVARGIYVFVAAVVVGLGVVARVLLARPRAA